MARWLHDFLARLFGLLGSQAANIMGVVGVALLGHGLWQISTVLAEIVLGVVLIIAVALGVRSNNGAAR